MSAPTSDILRQVPPYDEGLEREVLGFCLKAKDFTAKLYDTELSPEDFYVPLHGRMFAILSKQCAKNGRADLFALGKALEKDADFLERGGPKFPVDLIQYGFGERSAIQAAQHVKELSRRRALIAGLSESLYSAMDTRLPLQDVTSSAYGALSVVTSHVEARKVVTQAAVLDGVYEEIVNLMEGHRGPLGISTGFDALDRATCGLCPGEYYLLAGRPGTGKTAFSLNLATFIASSGSPVLYFSLEMPRDQLIKRLLSYTLNIDSMKFRGEGRFTQDEKDRFFERGVTVVREMPIHYYDFSRIQAHEIRTLMHIYRERHGVQAVILDYIGLVKPDRNNKSRAEAVSDISAALREAAKDLKLPVFALCQMNRNAEYRSGEPQLSDLRESGSLEQDADVVMFLYQDPDVKEEEQDDDMPRLVLKLAKNRHGPQRKIKMLFNKAMTRFSEARWAETTDGRQGNAPHWQDQQ